MRIIPIAGFSEPFSSISHLIAAGVFFVLGIILMVRGSGHAGRVFALGIFSFSIVFLLAMSGVYHLLEPGGTARA
ncbi:MAG: DNA-binding protein, partial [Gammaproteobacteria bacterium]|nr:DNA-binding protein [Gammaproteobacteria bacterium]